MFQKINQDLQAAIKNKDVLRTSVLRMMKSKITYIAPKADIPESEMLKIINKYAKDLKEAAELAEKVGRPEAAVQLKNELKIVEEYLPKQLSDEEIQALVKSAIEKVGATSAKEMGKVIKEVISQNPTLDGQKVKNTVLAQLSGT